MPHYGGYFDTPVKKRRLEELESLTENPDFWTDKKSISILKEKTYLSQQLQELSSLEQGLEDLSVLLEFILEGDSQSEKEFILLIEKCETLKNKLETQLLLQDPDDPRNVVVAIHAGAGGTEACDWAQMILRMLLRFCELQKWKVEIIDDLPGDSAGIRHTTFTVEGDWAYGFMKSENGVHRLVRISPFDSNQRRHTSFCSVFVTALMEDDEIEIDIKDKDLRIDTFRAGGAGGQHVNRTDSAVRMTHLPTGIVVQNQSQRSQLQNRETCLKILKAKLYELEVEKRKQSRQSVEDAKLENSFGSQIRSYVLHPYKMVKDARTAFTSHDPQRVLDGDILDFSLEYLRQKSLGQFNFDANLDL